MSKNLNALSKCIKGAIRRLPFNNGQASFEYKGNIYYLTVSFSTKPPWGQAYFLKSNDTEVKLLDLSEESVKLGIVELTMTA